jgi:hypothetical protein
MTFYKLRYFPTLNKLNIYMKLLGQNKLYFVHYDEPNDNYIIVHWPKLFGQYEEISLKECRELDQTR